MNGGIEWPRLGLGCASYWARPQFPEDQARAVIQEALEQGIGWFDTGASYADGGAERRLGRILRELGVRAESVRISTKIGTLRDRRGRLVKAFAPHTLTDQLAQSLKRLGLERVDVLFLHGPGPSNLDEGMARALEALRERGLVSHFGVNADTAVLDAALTDPCYQVLMPFFSVANPAAAEWIQSAASTGRLVTVAAPLGRMSFDLPWRDWLSRPSGRWYLARLLARSPGELFGRRRLREALRHPGWTPAELALAWVLEQPGVGAAVFGTTRVEHVRSIAAASRRRLPDPVRDALARLYGGHANSN
ncbi:MAG: aldo/keto reductase family protein [Wenzhouxiangellaceae bacterium]